MKFNPITNRLYSNDGNLLKELHCPLNKQWENLSQAIPLKGKLCEHCDKVIIDTSLLKEKDIIEEMQNDPGTCLKVDINQENLIITYE